MANERIVIFHHDERGAAVHWSEMGELVRCKDCKHWTTGAENFCDIDGQSRNSYWYCADGEREGGDE